VLAAELDAVLGRRLYPRSLLTPFVEDVELTHADRRSYTSYASTQRFKEQQTINVRFEPRPENGGETERSPLTEPDG
jgi:membrane protein